MLLMQTKRLLGPHKNVAFELFKKVENLPLLCPHGHVDPSLLSTEDLRFPDPVALFLRPDHYLLRMLYSQGHSLEFFLDETIDPRTV